MMYSTSIFVFSQLASLAFASSNGLPSSPRNGGPAPLLEPRDANLIIPDKYVVKLVDKNPMEALDDVVSSLGIEPDAVYNMTGFKGFAGTLDIDKLAILQNRPEVEFIEPDAEVKAYAYISQDTPPWGLARISHRTKGRTSYMYDDSAGRGTCTYIVDTGIYTGHLEFHGRALNVFDSTGESKQGDNNGHGTHVAGIAGSRTYGVAKATRLFGVKVLDTTGTGTISGVISGLNFVATSSSSDTDSCPAGSVANISLGGSYSAALNSATAALVSSGVFVAVASGSSNDDASRYSPASALTACTVSATDESDVVTASSNSGPLVDVYAPGRNVLSTWNTGPTSTIVLSGTSMAAAYVSGLGAYLLALEGPRDGVELCQRIQDLSTKNRVTPVPVGTNNYLAFNGNPSG